MPSASKTKIDSTLPIPQPAKLQAASAANKKNWPLLALGSQTQP